MWSSMVTHSRNLCSTFILSKVHTLSSEHTPGAVGRHCCGTRGAVGGSVPCSRVSPQSWYRRWRERSSFTPPTDNSCQTRDLNPQPQVTSPTPYPLGHDCPGADFGLWFNLGTIAFPCELHGDCIHQIPPKKAQKGFFLLFASYRDFSTKGKTSLNRIEIWSFLLWMQ